MTCLVMVQLCLVTIASLVPAAGTAQAQPVGPQLVIDFNMCGNGCLNNGSNPIANEIRSVLNYYQPRAMTLQEVCKSQFNTILNNLSSYKGRFDKTRSAACGDYGNAVIWDAAISNGISYSTPLFMQPGHDEQRAHICIYLGSIIDDLWSLCSTHLTPGSSATRQAIRAKQIDEVVSDLAFNRSQFRPSILGADLNNRPYDDPSDLSHLVDSFFFTAYGSEVIGSDTWQSDGEHVELSGCCVQRVLRQFEATFQPASPSTPDHKLDYVLLDPVGLLPIGDAWVVDTVRSDHHYLFGYYLHL